MKKIILKSVLIILGGIFMLSLFGCSANKYEIDAAACMNCGTCKATCPVGAPEAE